jgi:hypothetical protein
MKVLKNNIIQIDDKLSVQVLEDHLYRDAMEKYSNPNDFHIPSPEEGHYIADNYYMTFGPGVSYLTTESPDDKSVTTIDLGLTLFLIEDINEKHPTILIKFF